MHAAKRAAKCTASCFSKDRVAPAPVTAHAAGPSTPARTANRSRRYQLSLPNDSTNVNRYRDSGRTHRKGLTAMSWVTIFVVASKSDDPVAESASQNRIVHTVGGAPSSSLTGAA